MPTAYALRAAAIQGRRPSRARFLAWGLGVATVNKDLLFRVLDQYKEASALVAVATPRLVVFIQGLHLLYVDFRRWGRHKGLFVDDARRPVAAQVRQALRSTLTKEHGAENQALDAASRKLDGLCCAEGRCDPLFVALYHSKAPQHLIEWARRWS